MEVFAAGRAAGREWTTGHLDEMVANFAALREHIKPPLKLGHDSKQILAQRDGQPALGWVRDLKRQGDKLVAFVADMPKVVRDAVNAGRWRRVSSELFTAFENTQAEAQLKSGVKGHVLTGVALLGAEMPEVKTLKDLELLLSTGEQPVTCSESACGDDMTAVEFAQAPIARVALSDGETEDDDDGASLRSGNAPRTDNTRQEGHSMTDQEISEMVANKVAEAKAEQAAELAKRDAQLVKLSEDNARLAKEAEAAALAREEARKQAIAARADSLVAEFSSKDNYRLTPAMQPIVKALASKLGDGVLVAADDPQAPMLFSEKETPRDLNGHDLLRKLISAMPDHKVMFTEKLRSEQPKDEDILGYAQTVAKRENLDWNKRDDKLRAVELASKERPDLVSRDRA